MPLGEETEGELKQFIVAIGNPGQKDGPEASLLVLARNSVEASSLVPTGFVVKRVSHQYRTDAANGPSRVVAVFGQPEHAVERARATAAPDAMKLAS